MDPTTLSIFDLSPSEKLQLVEDLWDDLAATPDAVPIHDGHKEELARRKANLMQNPASGLVWKDVQHRVRSRLAVEFIIALKRKTASTVIQYGQEDDHDYPIT